VTILQQQLACGDKPAHQLRQSLVRAFPGMDDADYDQLVADVWTGKIFFGEGLYMPKGYSTLLDYASLRNQVAMTQPGADVSSQKERIEYLEYIAPKVCLFFRHTGTWQARLLGRLDRQISYLSWMEGPGILYSERKTV
jgi:hypothetical protein